MLEAQAQGRRSLWRLGVVFLGVLATLDLLYYAESKLELGLVDRPYTRLVAWSGAQVGRLVLPYPVRSQGAVIVADERNSILIASGCNGLEAIFLMVAGIVAYPATWQRRGRALAAYLPALFALNLVRIVALVHVAARHSQYMDLAHYQVAQGILILFVMAFWLNYIRSLDQ